MLSAEKYGIAIDLGTTTIAAALLKRADGAVLATDGVLNPQRSYGSDVVSRLEYASRSAVHLQELQSVVNGELASLAEKLLMAAGIDDGAVDLVAVAANPAMSHLLLGLPIDTLTHPPYRPRFTGAYNLRTSELAWGSDLPLYVFPSPGGFVGGDTVAFLYGLGFPDSGSQIPDTALFLDLGTNAEIVLLADGKLYATSAAAGPAFEGGGLSCGMAALPGAICSVAEEDGRLITATVSSAPPKGLCGSGVLDTVALLLEEGLLDTTGQLLHPTTSSSPLGSRLQDINGERHFVVYRDAKTFLSLSQGDIRQVQLAKGAVRAGIEVLFKCAGVSAEELKEVVITGTFGASLRRENLKTVGVLTESMLKKTGFVCDGALAGVIRALIDFNSSRQIKALTVALKIIPLSGTPLFEHYFMKNIGF